MLYSKTERESVTERGNNHRHRHFCLQTHLVHITTTHIFIIFRHSVNNAPITKEFDIISFLNYVL